LAIDTFTGAIAPLNEGQWEILRLVAAGYTNAEIARRRSLTEDAVNKAVTRLVKQLDIPLSKEGNTRVLLTQAYNRITGTVSERRS
jgi:DNA-binding NarL/FixJ family response regulator